MRPWDLSKMMMLEGTVARSDDVACSLLRGLQIMMMVAVKQLLKV